MKRLVCACCGAPTRGKQWHNRDKGYGVCVQCFREELQNSGLENAVSMYGHPGINLPLLNEGELFAVQKARCVI